LIPCDFYTVHVLAVKAEVTSVRAGLTDYILQNRL